MSAELESSVLAEPVPVNGYEAPASRPLLNGLRLLMEQRFFVFRVTAYGLVLATLLAFLIPVRYESTTQLMPPDSELSSGLASMLAMGSGNGNALGMLAGDLLGLKSSGSLFIGILRSRTVEDRIIEKFNLKSVYGVKQMLNARRLLEANTQITEDRKSGIITINVSDHSAQRAADMAQAYVAELDRLVVELNTSAAHRQRIFLEERLKVVRQDLDSAEKDFSDFSSKNAAININEQGKTMVEAAATLQGHLIAAQSELEGLRQIYTDSNVRVRAVRARIGELQKELVQMGGGDVDAAAADGKNALLYPSIRKLPLLGVTYADLYRKTKTQETLFELLTQQCELAKMQEAREIPSVKVLDASAVPEKKSFPPRLLIMFLGSLFALVIAMLWVLGHAKWEALDAQHPGKLLAHEAYTNLKADLRLASANGFGRHKTLWLKRPSPKL